ncbi:MAG: aminopeptidase [Candidatus Sabulitectum sp.]|nr:aminopeptidase [Candidatus Sabulitectum sp.]
MKGLQVLSSPKELKLLANENAYAILDMLRKQEYSGIGIAGETGMDCGLASYYLRKLEKHNLIEIVRTEKRRGATEKFYRATAENFLIHTDVGKAPDKILRSLSNAYLDNVQYTRMNKYINECIDIIVNESLKITKDTKVYIMYMWNNIEFLERLAASILHAGAEFRIFLNSPFLVKKLMSSVPIDSVQNFFNYKSDEFEWADVWINLGNPPKLDMSSIPAERLDKIARIRREALPGLRMNEDLRTMVVSLLSFEQDFQNEPRIFERMEMYWKAASLKMNDYRIMKETADILLSRKKFRIESGQHAELQVELKSDNYILFAGPLSEFYTGHKEYIMPSGGIEMLPEEAGINGEIYCELLPDDVTRISGVRLKIENNVVVNAKADKGLDLLQARLDSQGIEGRTISQIGFGLNCQIKSSKLLPKIANMRCGAVNIAFGSNKRIGGTIADDIANWELSSLFPTVFSGDELVFKKNKFKIS